MFIADLTQEEVETPRERWCAAGHQAAETFRRTGPDSPAEPTKFFLVTGHGIHGIYCEPCLVIAHHMAQLKKQGKME